MFDSISIGGNDYHSLGHPFSSNYIQVLLSFHTLG